MDGPFKIESKPQTIVAKVTEELPQVERTASGNWILVAAIFLVVVIAIPIVAVAAVVVVFAVRKKP